MGRKLARRVIDREVYELAERENEWLSTLLDAYAICDKGMKTEITMLERRRGRVACQKGRHACCLRESVPVTQLELQGISWCISEDLRGPRRDTIKGQLRSHKERTACPFLVEGDCAIYPVRPLACRQFFVFGKPCEAGEDILKTRPGDIAARGKNVGKQVAMRFLENYGYKRKSEKVAAFRAGEMVRLTGQVPISV